MQILKLIVLGVLFSIFGCALLGVVAFMRGGLAIEHSHATGLSAVMAGIESATIYSPVYWLIIVVAFLAAYWFVRRA